MAAVALAGCTVVHAPGAAEKPTGSAGTTATPSRPAPGPEQRAVAAAEAMLASFAVPPGGRKVPVAPDADKGALRSSPIPGTPDLVDSAAWWIAPGAPLTVLDWEAEHLPHRFLAAGTGTAYAPIDATVWSDVFLLPPIPGASDSRVLLVEMVQDGARTAIRVDAEVPWQPAPPASEKIPATAKAVTISMNLGMNQGSRKPPKPVTITDPAKVRRLRTLINSLPLTPPGTFHCPAEFGDTLVLTFRARPGAPGLAVATDILSGCGGVHLTIGGKPQPALASASGPWILRTAGLPWLIPAF